MKKLKTPLGIVLSAVFLVTFGCNERDTNPGYIGRIPPGEYVVTENDDLTGVALQAYGDAGLWHSLLNANPQIAKRPHFFLKVGETITVPPLDKLDKSLPKSVFPKQLPADYIVMPGDSLFFIAKSCYGDRDLWIAIYEANREVLSERVKENPYLLIAGQVLHIPSREQAARSADRGESTRAAER